MGEELIHHEVKANQRPCSRQAESSKCFLRHVCHYEDVIARAGMALHCAWEHRQMDKT